MPPRRCQHIGANPPILFLRAHSCVPIFACLFLREGDLRHPVRDGTRVWESRFAGECAVFAEPRSTQAAIGITKGEEKVLFFYAAIQVRAFARGTMSMKACAAAERRRDFACSSSHLVSHSSPMSCAALSFSP